MAKLILLFNVFEFVWQSINLSYSIRNIICLEAAIELCFSLFRHHLGAHLEHNEAMKSIKSLKHHRLDVATCSDEKAEPYEPIRGFFVVEPQHHFWSIRGFISVLGAIQLWGEFS